MSGVIPKRSCAPPFASRQPVITSSKIESAPAPLQSETIASRKPGSGGTQPMFPTTGSTMTQAISWPCFANAARSAGSSLNGSVSVVRAVPSGTPAESGTPKVARPLPALTRR